MNLFEPIRIGKLLVKNRIGMAPMGLGVLIKPDGSLSQRALDYYVARAKGGVGLIITCAARIGRVIEGHSGASLTIDPNADTTWLRELADLLHSNGTRVCMQLTAGLGRVANPKDPRSLVHDEMVAPSAVPCFYDPNLIARALTISEIERIVQGFEVAAKIVAASGIDAVELHGHEGYLFDQFMTSLWNKRTDKYGGDLAGRMRFSVEVINAIKNGAGADFPVVYRFGLEHHLPGGREIPEGLEVARRLEDAGVDALDVDAGCYETTWWPHPTQYQPPACMVDLAEKTKKVVKIPVMSAGKLGYPDLAERLLQEGKTDFVLLGRPLLADPDWVNKVEKGLLDDIRPCICDHDGCSARSKGGLYVSCTVNPTAGMEREYALERAAKRKKVLVIGGGPAGMEASAIAAQRGHEVTLWEKTPALGGNLIAAGASDFKEDYRRLNGYLSDQLAKCGVRVELGKEGSPRLVAAMKPDVVFVATGGAPIIPPIPGVDKGMDSGFVVLATDYLLSKKTVGKSVAIIGGGLVGCETALDLVRRGKAVTIIEQMGDIATLMFWRNRNHLLKLLADAQTTVMTNHRVIEVTERGLSVCDCTGQRSTLEVESVILAAGYVADHGLFESIKNDVPLVSEIGDCLKPRKLIDAIWEGFGAARLV